MGGDRRSVAIEGQAETILSLLAERPDTTLAEFQAALAEKGHRFSVSTIWRFFDRRQLTLKKRPRTRPSRSAPTSCSAAKLGSIASSISIRRSWFSSMRPGPPPIWRAATGAPARAKG
jgi:hypothetical protein